MSHSTNFTKQQVLAWRDGASGFFRWLEDVRPMIPGSRGQFIPFQIQPFQELAVRKLLSCKPNGDFKYGTIGLTWPRRHSKSTIAALLVLWRMTTRTLENIVILSNSEKQSSTIGYGLCRKIVLATPALRAQVGAGNVQSFKMEVPALGNCLRTVSGNAAALYGEKLSCAWVSEIHAALNDEGLQILGSSLGDTENSWMLVDSTTDGVGGILHGLENLQESGQDETICIDRIQYADLAEALEKSPPWIRRDWLKSRSAQLLPAVFASQHLNLRQGSDQCLFSESAIQNCQERLPHPINKAALEGIAAGRTFVVGAALDRAYGFSLHGDQTIFTVVAKIASNPGEEPHYYVLNQQNILGSLGKLIKKAFQNAHDEYGLQNSIVESYNSQDVYTWCIERGIPSELVHATATAQVPAFTELHRIVSEGRLHFSDQLTDLAREMQVFQYSTERGQPKFGTDRHHDDRIYSLCWAIHSLRQQELASFSLQNIICNSRSSHAASCYLRSGNLILHCSNTCPSHIQTLRMYNQYRRANLESEISLPDFFHNLVQVDGVRLYS